MEGKIRGRKEFGRKRRKGNNSKRVSITQIEREREREDRAGDSERMNEKV